MEPLTRDDPRQIAGYRLQARLGAGGMGLVYLGFTPGGRAVAVKVMRPELGDDRGFRDRFRQEIEAARRVHGLYTAQVIDADPAAVPPWLVTVYVAGPSLQQAVADHGPMPAQTGYRIMAGVAEALQAIHAAGVVHRDLKPSNVLLAADGPRVIDFGIARAVEATALTRTGMLIGSPQFMAPEQVAGQPTTPATDIFALGSLAAYAVLGRAPFGDGVGEAVLYRVLHQDPDLAGCPMPLRTVIERCLARDPARRPGPAEIVWFCQAQQGQGREPGHATEPAQPWLPPGVAADLAERSVLAPALPGQATPADELALTPTAVATSAAGGPPRPEPGRPTRRIVTWAGIAAAVVVAVAAGALVTRQDQHDQPAAAVTRPHRNSRPSPHVAATSSPRSPSPSPSPPPTAAPPASPAAAPPEVFTVCTTPQTLSNGQTNCGDTSTLAAQPGAIYPSGNDTVYVRDISWSGWGSPAPVGSGTGVINKCQPTCAGSTSYAYPPVTITLSDPVPDGQGEKAYNTMSVTGLPGIHTFTGLAP
jgi:serine/threonine kinase PknH